MRIGGLCFPPNGGHDLGRKLPAIFAGTDLSLPWFTSTISLIVFTAVVLQDQEAIAFIKSKAGYSEGCFHEDAMTPEVTSKSGGGEALVLFGQSGSASQYWQNQIDDSGSRTLRVRSRYVVGLTDQDPYGYIDGGERPGGSYQYCCNAMNWHPRSSSGCFSLTRS